PRRGQAAPGPAGGPGHRPGGAGEHGTAAARGAQLGCTARADVRSVLSSVEVVEGSVHKCQRVLTVDPAEQDVGAKAADGCQEQLGQVRTLLGEMLDEEVVEHHEPLAIGSGESFVVRGEPLEGQGYPGRDTSLLIEREQLGDDRSDHGTRCWGVVTAPGTQPVE